MPTPCYIVAEIGESGDINVVYQPKKSGMVLRSIEDIKKRYPDVDTSKFQMFVTTARNGSLYNNGKSFSGTADLAKSQLLIVARRVASDAKTAYALLRTVHNKYGIGKDSLKERTEEENKVFRKYGITDGFVRIYNLCGVDIRWTNFVVPIAAGRGYN